MAPPLIILLLDSIDSNGRAHERVIERRRSLRRFPGARVIVTGRTGRDAPDTIVARKFGRLEDAEIKSDHAVMDLNPGVRGALPEKIKGNWLLAAVFAEEAEALTTIAGLPRSRFRHRER
jgi:hypothetical protein